MTTEIENGEEAGKPQVSGRVKIEWNWDLDDEGQQIKSILLIRDTPHVRLYVLNMFRMRGSRL